MTIEERAKECAKEYVRLCYEWSSEGSRISTWDEEIKRVEEAITNIAIQALRDQIEDCAKIADKMAQDFINWNWPDKQRYAPTIAETAQSIAENIRALAEPTEDRKEIER